MNNPTQKLTENTMKHTINNTMNKPNTFYKFQNTDIDKLRGLSGNTILLYLLLKSENPFSYQKRKVKEEYICDRLKISRSTYFRAKAQIIQKGLIKFSPSIEEYYFEDGEESSDFNIDTASPNSETASVNIDTASLNDDTASLNDEIASVNVATVEAQNTVTETVSEPLRSYKNNIDNNKNIKDTLDLRARETLNDDDSNSSIDNTKLNKQESTNKEQVPTCSTLVPQAKLQKEPVKRSRKLRYETDSVKRKVFSWIKNIYLANKPQEWCTDVPMLTRPALAGLVEAYEACEENMELVQQYFKDALEYAKGQQWLLARDIFFLLKDGRFVELGQRFYNAPVYVPSRKMQETIKRGNEVSLLIKQAVARHEKAKAKAQACVS